MATMKCPYLKKVMPSEVCEASITGMKPSSFEQMSYCSTEEHYRCPLLLAYALRSSHRKSRQTTKDSFRF